MKINNKSKGFTLVEVLVGMSAMIILGFAIAGLQYIMTQNQLLVFDNSIKVEISNSNLASLVRELRTARGGDNGAYAIESATHQAITFYSNIDDDSEAEKVRYFLQGTNLSKGIIEPVGYPVTYPSANEKVKIVSENVQNGTIPIFYYYNGDWPQDSINNPLPQPIDVSEVKLMRVYLRTNTRTNDPQSDYVLESVVQIRTLKENL